MVIELYLLVEGHRDAWHVWVPLFFFVYIHIIPFIQVVIDHSHKYTLMILFFNRDLRVLLWHANDESSFPAPNCYHARYQSY